MNIITILPVITKDLPISPRCTPYVFFYRDASSAILQLANQWLNVSIYPFNLPLMLCDEVWSFCLGTHLLDVSQTTYHTSHRIGLVHTVREVERDTWHESPVEPALGGGGGGGDEKLDQGDHHLSMTLFPIRPRVVDATVT